MITKLHLIFACLLIVSCNTARDIPYTRTAEVVSIKSTDRTITLHASTQAASINQAILYSERLAMENILFRGIPKSSQEHPIIADEYKTTTANKAYFEWLLSEQAYRRFYIESTLYRQQQTKGNAFITQQITIDLEALRKDLEQQNVIRKFGL